MSVDPATGYYPNPYSFSPLPPHVDVGLVIIGSLACLSIFMTISVLTFICHRFILWQKHRTGYNQCLILVFNLLLADFHQALSMVINFHWRHVNGIFAPTAYCWAQGAILNFGNFASGSFVFLIALHTCFTVFKGGNVDHRWFAGIIVFVWVVGVIMSVAGPWRFGAHFYTRAGNWCWISEKYETERLVLHYLWIFVYQFGTICIYAGLFFYIHRVSRRTRVGSSLPSSNSQVNKAARYMIIYPIVYLIGTLPIAIGRMLTFAGMTPSSRYFLWAGAMLSSCGWVDGLVYAFTRKVFTNDDNNGHRLSNRWTKQQEHKSSNDSNCPLSPNTDNQFFGASDPELYTFNHNDLDKVDSLTINQVASRYHFDVPDWDGHNLLFLEKVNTENAGPKSNHLNQDAQRLSLSSLDHR